MIRSIGGWSPAPRRPGVTTAAAFAVILACCSTPTGQDEVVGRYRLVSLEGFSLPYQPTFGCCIYTGGSLVLESESYEMGISATNRNNFLEFTATEIGTYRFEGDGALTFTPTGGDQPLFLHGARFSAGVITLDIGGDGPGADDQFRAVFNRD